MSELIQLTAAMRGADPFDGGRPRSEAMGDAGTSSGGMAPKIGFTGGPGIAPRSAIDSFHLITGGVIEQKGASRSSLALSNLRAFVILTVVAFHSVMAYLGSLGPVAFSFDDPPYKWRAFPIIDSHRFYGFDVFCAWQDVYLMSLMFFLSALFTWPSLARKGSGRFLSDRFMRLGLPFAFAVVVVMPLALYPVYRLSAVDPSVMAYARHYLALPFWPNGPMWFLWQLLALTIVAAGVHRFVPQWVGFLARCSSGAGARPGRYFIGLAIACTLAYVPLALAFTPWDWSNGGPLSFQLSRPLLYAVVYFAGLGIGALGLERGLLAPEGMLARSWAVWFAGALAAFLAWMGLTALAMTYTPSAPLGLQVVVDSCFALACASGCFFVMGACLRFATMRSRMLASLANNAFGIYLLHYPFVVWLQYALLGVALFAIAKAMVVFGGALLLAWAAAIVMRLVPFGSRLIGAERLVRRPASSSAGSLRGTLPGALAGALAGKWRGELSGDQAGTLARGLARDRQFDGDRARLPPPSLAR
jgi:peptidoglycan/LPS O-acetylase OafA/YrhL